MAWGRWLVVTIGLAHSACVGIEGTDVSTGQQPSTTGDGGASADSDPSGVTANDEGDDTMPSSGASDTAVDTTGNPGSTGETSIADTGEGDSSETDVDPSASTGTDSTGTDGTGTDSTGTDSTGTDSTGTDSGTDGTDSGSTGPDEPLPD
jgi:hypothetical protein